MKEMLRARRWELAYPVALIGTCGALLGFRHLATLDGPLHVLHGHFFSWWLQGAEPGTATLRYDLGQFMPSFTDLIAWPLLQVLDGPQVHDVLAVLSILSLGLALWALAHRVEAANDLRLLLVLPWSIGYLFVLGFFNFYFGVAAAFGVFAWHLSRQRSAPTTLVGLLVGGLACYLIHRGALFLLALLVGAHELRHVLQWRQIPARKRGQVVVLLLPVALVGVYALAFLYADRLKVPEERQPLMELLSLRPLLMLDRAAEQVYRLGFGLLLAGALLMALFGKFDNRPSGMQAIGLSGVGLLVASLVIRSPGADLHYFCERAQWLGVLLLILWSCTVPVRLSYATLLGVAALCLHGARLLYMEQRTAPMAHQRNELMSAIPQFPPQSLVIPVFREANFLLMHQAAWLMIEHDGLVLSRRDKFWLSARTPEGLAWRKRFGRRFYDADHSSSYLELLRQERGQVLVIGTDTAAKDSSWQALSPILNGPLRRDWKNNYAELFKSVEGL
ncbi:MAG: hypothetical protein KDB88_04090 [Flavobacteriales bacterium]|nr:hypothetical protein [Flavobacteriales bacterium]